MLDHPLDRKGAKAYTFLSPAKMEVIDRAIFPKAAIGASAANGGPVPHLARLQPSARRSAIVRLAWTVAPVRQSSAQRS